MTDQATRVIDSVHVGPAVPLARGETSAIRKHAVTGPVAVGFEGLTGDEQADRVNHGGPEQAVHYYPAEHHAFWAELHPAMAEAFAPGSFGENLSGRGQSESDVLVGDIWRLGTVVVEVSQGRQPCWKIDARFGVTGLTAAVLRTGRSGWYMRVIEPGLVAAGDGMRLLDRPSHGWTVARVAAVVLGKASAEELRAVAALSALSPKWRERAARRAAAMG